MNINTGATVNIINKLYASTDVFEITNTGAVKIIFGFCHAGVTPVDSGISLAVDEKKNVTAAELGDYSINQYLNCTNNDISIGRFKIKLP
jgi:hypothetical protein